MSNCVGCYLAEDIAITCPLTLDVCQHSEAGTARYPDASDVEQTSEVLFASMLIQGLCRILAV